MTYIVEKISPEDQQKIVDDVDPESKSSESQRKRFLRGAKKRNLFPENWAIDREKNHYLFRGPIMDRDEASCRPYYFFAYGRMYLFRLVSDGFFEKKPPSFFLDERVLPPQDELLRVQQEARLAFQCYGSSGNSRSRRKWDDVDFVPEPVEFQQQNRVRY